jgi:hypothetical protein
MMLIKSDARTEAGVLPDEKALTAMGHLNEEMTKAGVLLAAEGLHPSSRGARVRLSGKKTSVIDGPFTEPKKLVAGYWVIETKSKDEALDWAKRVPNIEGEVEVRQIYELSDFPVEPTEQAGGWRDQEQEQRQEWEKAPAPDAQPARQAGTRRYALLLKADQRSEAGVLPTSKELEKSGAVFEDLAKSGTMLAGEGLKPSAVGARVEFSGASRAVMDGPFAETKELIAGFTLVQTKSKEEAIACANRWLGLHVDLGADEAEIEVRELLEL